jgi:hypothetical protein
MSILVMDCLKLGLATAILLCAAGQATAAANNAIVERNEVDQPCPVAERILPGPACPCSKLAPGAKVVSRFSAHTWPVGHIRCTSVLPGGASSTESHSNASLGFFQLLDVRTMGTQELHGRDQRGSTEALPPVGIP